MKRIILLLCFLLLISGTAFAAQVPYAITSNTTDKTGVVVYKDKLVYTEDDFTLQNLRIYDLKRNSLDFVLSSPIPFEALNLNDKYIVWVQRSSRVITNKTTWQLYVYNLSTKKSTRLSNTDKIVVNPFLRNDYVIFQENSKNGNYQQIVKLHIPTLKRTILLNGTDVTRPKLHENLLLFSTGNSKNIHLLDVDTGKNLPKINSQMALNDANFTGDGVIWSTSYKEYSTTSELYEYLFSTGKTVQVIPWLSYGKGSNFINPNRVGKLVFYLSGRESTGFDLWMQDLASSKQYPLGRDVKGYSVSENLLAYIANKQIYIMPITKENFIPGKDDPIKISVSKNTAPSKPKKDYYDIENHWAKTAIKSLINKRIAAGDKNSDGVLVFRPEDSITRAEFCVLIAKALNIKGTKASNYLIDVSGHWAEPFINALYLKGVVTGRDPGYFRPEGKITRAEASAIIARLKNAYSKKNVPYKDVPASYWAFEEISGLTAQKILAGYSDKTFKPENKLTRAEAAVIMNQIIKN